MVWFLFPCLVLLLQLGVSALLGGGCSLFAAILLFRRCIEGFPEWHFDAQWSPGLANSL